MDLHDLAQQIEKLAEERDQTTPFKYPRAVYNKYGDQIEVLFSDEESYAEWKNSQITLIRSQRTNEIIGVEICGVLGLVSEE